MEEIKIDPALTALLGGDEAENARLCQAYSLGRAAGVLDGRADGRRIEALNTTINHLRCLVRSGRPLEESMILLDIPRKERKTYEKIFESRASQKRKK